MTDHETSMTTPPETSFTWDEVVPGLFQGDFPDGEVDWSIFDDVVSMSNAAPDPRLGPDGVWLHVPIWDGEMDQPEADALFNEHFVAWLHEEDEPVAAAGG